MRWIKWKVDYSEQRWAILNKLMTPVKFLEVNISGGKKDHSSDTGTFINHPWVIFISAIKTGNNWQKIVSHGMLMNYVNPILVESLMREAA